MANIKSAKKRVLVTKKKTLRNKTVKSRAKTAIKKVLTAKPENAAALMPNAQKEIDKACAKGVYHKNTAARKKSRLQKRINRLAPKKPAA